MNRKDALDLIRDDHSHDNYGRLLYVVDDGGIVCGKCATTDCRGEVLDSTPGDGWHVIGVDSIGNAEGYVVCDHCGDMLQEPPADTPTPPPWLTVLDALGGAVDADQDGRWTDVADGWSVRVRMEPDYDTRVTDYPDLYGRIVHVDDSPRDYNTGRRRRPDDMDGGARKVWAGREGYWWQPPADVVADPDALESVRGSLVDALEYGYGILVVDVRHTRPDGYAREGTGALGAIDPMPHADYLEELAADCYADALAEVTA